jgi:predicted TIM-barrel fold metal-dependent hydrolase
MSPRLKAPPGAIDCHFHIFGPTDRYPQSPGRSYDPVEASVEAYLAMAATLGLQRMVVVQASIYGTDNSCTLDAVDRFGRHRACAVAVVDDSFDAAALRALDRRGVRGVRFNAVSGNGTPLDQLETLARRIEPLGWHLQLYAHGAQLPELAERLLAPPVPVVIDHMGQVPTGRGLDSPEFQVLLRLLRSGRCWVKLSGYRIAANGPPYADVLAPARALIAAAPERCVWGTDWPHPHLEGRPMPDDGLLLDLLGEWAPDPAQQRRILVDTPAALYGF